MPAWGAACALVTDTVFRRNAVYVGPCPCTQETRREAAPSCYIFRVWGTDFFLTLAFGTDWCSKGVPQYHWLPFLLGVGGGRDKLVLADGVPLSLASGGRVHGVVEERGAAARIRGAWHKWGHRGLPHMCSRPRAWYVEDCFMET